MKAMIFAAGLGTRLKPLTNTKPKALAEINGVPLLEVNIRKLISFGFNDIIVNIHHFPEQIISFLRSKNNFNINIQISNESDLLLDTGGGIKKAGSLLQGDGPILIHNVDIVSNIDLGALYQTHKKNHVLATLACMERKSSREFLMNAAHELCAWRNNKTGELKIARENESNLSPIAFTGIHIIEPELPGLISENGVFSIIDVYLRLAKEHKIMIEKLNNPVWIDLGTPENLEKASKMNFN